MKEKAYKRRKKDKNRRIYKRIVEIERKAS